MGLLTPYDPKAIYRLARKFVALQRSFSEPLLVHAHLTPCQVFAPIAARLSGAKCILVTTEHSPSNKRRKMLGGRWLDNFILRYYRRIICISEAVATAVQDWQPKLTDRIATIPNGIDLKIFVEGGASTRESQVPIVISVGRLHRLKNYETAIKACALIDHLHFEYHILGHGRNYARLERLIKESGLQAKVKLLGFRTNVTPLLNQSHIFLMPSLWEGFGLSAVEAMASGLPVLASDVPGVRDVVGVEQECGFLFDPNRPEQIAERLERLLLSPALRRAMGNRAKSRAMNYSIEKTADGYLSLYDELLSKNAGRV